MAGWRQRAQMCKAAGNFLRKFPAASLTEKQFLSINTTGVVQNLEDKSMGTERDSTIERLKAALQLIADKESLCQNKGSMYQDGDERDATAVFAKAILDGATVEEAVDKAKRSSPIHD